jgi:hypothetical protein
MAWYQKQSELTYSNSAVFNLSYGPGANAPYGGVYKCTGCGHEIGIARYHSLPPQNHHTHVNQYVPIRWQPVVIHT